MVVFDVTRLHGGHPAPTAALPLQRIFASRGACPQWSVPRGSAESEGITGAVFQDTISSMGQLNGGYLGCQKLTGQC